MELSRLELVIDSKGVVTANGNLDIFKQKAKEAENAGNSLKNSAKGFGDQMTQSMFGSVTAAGLAAAALLKVSQAGIDLVKSSIEASGQLEMIRANLTTVMGSAELAAKTFEDLKEFANRTPFEINGITDSAIMLKQSGVAAGDLISTLQALGDAAGGSQEKLNRIALNYAQIMSVGKAATMDIKQFAMAGLPIYDSLAKALHVNNEQLGDMISNGKVTKDVIVQAFKDMTAEGGAFFKGMDRGAQTLEGKISTLKDSIKSMQAQLADTTGLSALTKEIVDLLTKVASETTSNAEFATANNAVMNGGGTDSQVTLVATARVEAIRKKIQEIQQAVSSMQGVEGSEVLISKYNDDVAELLDNLDYWRNRLNEINQKQKYQNDLEKQRQAGIKDTTAAMDAYSKSLENTARWQEVLKKAFNLEELPKTGAQAFSEYQNNIEASLNGAVAYAQMTGGKISDVYLDYAKQVGDAAEMLLKSGLWTPDEETIKRVMALRNLYGAIGGEKSTAEPDLSNPGAITGTKFASGQQGESEYEKQIKALDEQAAAFGRSREEQRRYELSLQGITDKTEQDTIIQKEKVIALQEAWKNLASQLEQFGANAVFQSLWDMGDALYEGENAAQAFGRSLLKSILQNVPAMLFQTGFEMAITGNLYAGLALMAASGLAGVAGGYLTAMMNDSDSQQSEADKLQKIADQLSDLITEARSEALYYQTTLRSLTASSNNTSISKTSVNDAIIAPGGRVITTAPDDYLYAAKDPGKFGGAGGSVVNISVLNSAGDSVSATATSSKNADGTTQIIVAVKKIIQSEIASGGMDNAFAARDSRLRGRSVSS